MTEHYLANHGNVHAMVVCVNGSVTVHDHEVYEIWTLAPSLIRERLFAASSVGSSPSPVDGSSSGIGAVRRLNLSSNTRHATRQGCLASLTGPGRIAIKKFPF